MRMIQISCGFLQMVDILEPDIWHSELFGFKTSFLDEKCKKLIFQPSQKQYIHNVKRCEYEDFKMLQII